MLLEKWVVLSKSKILDGSPASMDGSEFMFGHSIAFAESEDRAVEQIKSALFERLDLELVEVLCSKRYDEDDWADGSELSELVNRAAFKAGSAAELAVGGLISSNSAMKHLSEIPTDDIARIALEAGIEARNESLDAGCEVVSEGAEGQVVKDKKMPDGTVKRTIQKVV